MPDSRPNPAHIIELASAFFGSCALFAASDLQVFGKLAELQQASSAGLAAALDVDERGLRLLLDGCVAAGLLTKSGEAYGNTPESAAFLVPGQPGDLSRALVYNRDVYSAWGKLKQLVQTGKPVETPQTHLGDDEARTRGFVLSMHGRALGMGRAVAPLIQVGAARQMLDVGGGPGTYSVLICQANPGLHSTVLDLPAVAAIASGLIQQQGAADRVKTLPGDYHSTPFPEGNDIVLFFGMLHQESPESILDLLSRACRSLNPGGRVYVMDMMTDATHTRPAFSALFAVNMALTTEHGWVFSDAELEGWLRTAGFVDFAVEPLPPPMPHWLASARKA